MHDSRRLIVGISGASGIIYDAHSNYCAVSVSQLIWG
jgi:3-polyprenyl-4-hydroxybenzoate decarboxylase